MTQAAKQEISRSLVQCISGESEVKRIIIFGSFFEKEEPGDIDVAIFVDSEESYLPLAMKYRKLTREIARKIPMDVLPIKMGARSDFLEEIYKGRTVYEQ